MKVIHETWTDHAHFLVRYVLLIATHNFKLKRFHYFSFCSQLDMSSLSDFLLIFTRSLSPCHSPWQDHTQHLFVQYIETSFCQAYQDGRVRAVFSDRAILRLSFPLAMLEQIQQMELSPTNHIALPSSVAIILPPLSFLNNNNCSLTLVIRNMFSLTAIRLLPSFVLNISPIAAYNLNSY